MIKAHVKRHTCEYIIDLIILLLSLWSTSILLYAFTSLFVGITYLIGLFISSLVHGLLFIYSAVPNVLRVKNKSTRQYGNIIIELDP